MKRGDVVVVAATGDYGKPVTVRRARIAQSIGHLDDGDIARLNVALAFVMGLAD
jgi:hypothetical protein